MMVVLSRVLEEAWKLGLMSAEDYHRVIAIERKTGQRLLKGRALSVGEVQALFHVCAQDESVKGSRDAASIAVLYEAGLRRKVTVQPAIFCIKLYTKILDMNRVCRIDLVNHGNNG